MSNRSRVLREQKALGTAPVVRSFPNVQAKPQQVQMGLEQLAEILISQGANRSYKIQFNVEHQIVRVVAECGPLSIPLDFSIEEARKMAQGIEDACAKAEPPAAEEDGELPAMSPEMEALLEQSIAATSGPQCPGCQRDLAGHEVSSVDGSWIAGKYYCYPCQQVVDQSSHELPAEDLGYTLATEYDTGLDTSFIHGAVARQEGAA
jgi:hypothetical protein